MQAIRRVTAQRPLVKWVALLAGAVGAVNFGAVGALVAGFAVYGIAVLIFKPTT